MFVDTSHRSNAPEIMDDFLMEGEVLRDALDKIANINRLLGGNKVTLEGAEKLLRHCDVSKEVTIIDVGCGNGDMLRTLARYADKRNLKFKLIGIDANAFTIKHAKQLSEGYSNISYRCADIFNEMDIDYDIVLCTLTLHHFGNEEILGLLQNFTAKAGIGIVINDLHRSAMAYYLFKALCAVFGLNYMSREDGLVSILRGFKKADLLLFSEKLHLKDDTIRWKWAFRYQWIIKTI